MPTLALSTRLLALRAELQADMDANPASYAVFAAHATQLAAFVAALDANAPIITQITATQIVAALAPVGGGTDFQMVLAGTGIGPVSSAADLATASEAGLATGTLNSLRLSQGAAELARLTLSPTLYTLGSGATTVTMGGSLPT